MGTKSTDARARRASAYVAANVHHGEDEADAIHVFTDAELRARDERIIRAAVNQERGEDYGIDHPWTDFDAIIAAADGL